VLARGWLPTPERAHAALPTNPPTINTISPTTGTADGGTVVTLTGNSFTGAGTVLFDGIAGKNMVLSGDASLTIVTTPHPAGTVNVVINSFIGTSNSIQFTYVAGGVPVITGINPVAGPPGTAVTVTGTGMTSVSGVMFGSTPGTGLSINSDTSITVAAPQHSAGTVDIVVSGPAGSSALTSADRYTFGSSVATATATATPTSTSTATPSASATSTPTATTTSTATPSATATQTPAAGPGHTYTLTFQWNLVVWAGQDGTPVSTALAASSGIGGRVTAIFRWDSPSQTWKAYFPGSDGIPGANDFSMLNTNIPYWIAISAGAPVTWTP
jgi:hypothetical protein